MIEIFPSYGSDVVFFTPLKSWLVDKTNKVRIEMQNRILYRNNVSQGFDNVIKIGLIAISIREKGVTSTL